MKRYVRCEMEEWERGEMADRTAVILLRDLQSDDTRRSGWGVFSQEASGYLPGAVLLRDVRNKD